MIIKLICIWLKVAIQIFATERYMFVDCLRSEPQTITHRTSTIKKLFILIYVNWCANKTIDVKVYQTGTVDDFKFISQKNVPSSSQTISYIDIGFFIESIHTLAVNMFTISRFCHLLSNRILLVYSKMDLFDK